MESGQQLSFNRGQPFQLLSEQLEKLAAADPALYNRFCSWQDVVHAIEKAKGLDNAKAERTFLGKHLRAPLRNSAPVVNTLDCLTNMIPDQNGLSILRGALTTVLKLVHLRLQTRDMILEVFEDIPDRFVKAVEAERRFPDAVDLRHAVAHLCDTLVANLGVLIPILVRSHPQKNVLARLWKQHPGKEQEVVQASLAEISRASKRVKRCSTAATERTIGEMHTMLCTISHSSTLFASDLKLLTAEISSSKTVVQSALENKDSPPGSPWPPWATVPTMAAPPLLAAAPFTPSGQMVYAPMSPLTPPPTASPQDILDDLLDAINVPDRAADDRLQNVARHGTDPSLNAGSRGEQLLRTERFQAWLAAPSSVSDLVMVDGHCGNAMVDTVSPMSAIAASLVEVVQHHPLPTIVLHHFCGPRIGPGCLIRSLVQQLLVQVCQHNDDGHAARRHLDFVYKDLISSVEDEDISALCRVFRELVFRLDPACPVFCIIDGVSEIETVMDGWQKETCLIVNTLVDLVDDEDRNGPALRVLLTSAERSTKLADTAVPSDRRVQLLAARVLGGQTPLELFQEDVGDLLMADDMDGDVVAETQDPA